MEQEENGSYLNTTVRLEGLPLEPIVACDIIFDQNQIGEASKRRGEYELEEGRVLEVGVGVQGPEEEGLP